MKSIIINIGSRSKKYSAFEDDKLIASEEFAGLPSDAFDRFVKKNNLDLSEHSIGVRIVSPGKYFTEHRRVDRAFLEKLKESEQIAPLHIESTRTEIEYIISKHPDTIIYAISDSAFHKSIPDILRDYAIPDSFRQKYGIEKQGYHGLSISSVVNTLINELGSIPEKLVVCHLGGGSSVTALKDGLSLDTSMGFTPLDGIPMAERVGSIDPGALIHLARMENMNWKDLLEFISHSCGLEAVSGVQNGDMKDLLDISEDPSHPNHHGAIRAVDLYVASVAKNIGSMVAVLGGIDMLIFTGTIGVRSAPIRGKICSKLGFIEANIGSDLNQSTQNPTESIDISLDSKVRILVVPTNEAKEIQTALMQSVSQ